MGLTKITRGVLGTITLFLAARDDYSGVNANATSRHPAGRQYHTHVAISPLAPPPRLYVSYFYIPRSCRLHLPIFPRLAAPRKQQQSVTTARLDLKQRLVSCLLSRQNLFVFLAACQLQNRNVRYPCCRAWQRPQITVFFGRREICGCVL